MSGPGHDPKQLLAAATGGDRVALARLLSLVERGGPPSQALAALAYGQPPPYSVGLTGAPGAGKSTLVARLLDLLPPRLPGRDPEVGSPRAPGPPDAGRPAPSCSGGAQARGEVEVRGEGQARGEPPKIAVVAVDPTSPFSGGAILADRIRMSDHATDPSIFIRSMATRGHLGGLAVAVPEAVRVLGAVGIGLVLIETVGVGQLEVEVASTADTTVVAVTPGWGDSMQANKAGLLEVADLFVINKADRPGGAETRRDLEQMLDLSSLGDWRPPIVQTVAATGEGVEELWAEVERHRAHLVESGELERRRRQRLRGELDRVLLARMLERIEDLSGAEAYHQVLEALAEGALDPYRAADRLLAQAER